MIDNEQQWNEIMGTVALVCAFLTLGTIPFLVYFRNKFPFKQRDFLNGYIVEVVFAAFHSLFFGLFAWHALPCQIFSYLMLANVGTLVGVILFVSYRSYFKQRLAEELLVLLGKGNLTKRVDREASTEWFLRNKRYFLDFKWFLPIVVVVHEVVYLVATILGSLTEPSLWDGTYTETYLLGDCDFHYMSAVYVLLTVEIALFSGWLLFKYIRHLSGVGDRLGVLREVITMAVLGGGITPIWQILHFVNRPAVVFACLANVIMFMLAVFCSFGPSFIVALRNMQSQRADADQILLDSSKHTGTGSSRDNESRDRASSSLTEDELKIASNYSRRGLKLVLQSEVHRKEFGAFLQKEWALENLLFWEECYYLKDENEENAPAVCKYIFDTFVKSKAQLQVNLPYHIFKDLSERAEQGNFDQTMYQAAQDSIFNLMLSDSFFRYRSKQSSSA